MKPRDADKLRMYNLLRGKFIIANKSLEEMAKASPAVSRDFIYSPEYRTEILQTYQRVFDFLYGEKTGEDMAIEKEVKKSFTEHRDSQDKKTIGKSSASIWRFIKPVIAGLFAVTAAGYAYKQIKGDKKKDAEK